MSDLDGLDPRYTTILCDVWGVVHDGARLFDGVVARFERWAKEGRRVVLVTNAPRPADRVEADIEALGLDRSHWHALTSSGQAGIAALTDPPRKVGFAGSRDDYDDLTANGVQIAVRGEAIEEIALTGLDEQRHGVDEYENEMAAWLEQDLLVHCLNPDRIVVHRGARIVCAGAIADAYAERGGRVRFYGKPHTAIFDHALKLAGNPDRDSVVMIGDAPATDMLGARQAGIDGVLVTGGITEGAAHDWAADTTDWGDWRPVLTVPGL